MGINQTAIITTMGLDAFGGGKWENGEKGAMWGWRQYRCSFEALLCAV